MGLSLCQYNTGEGHRAKSVTQHIKYKLECCSLTNVRQKAKYPQRWIGGCQRATMCMYTHTHTLLFLLKHLLFFLPALISDMLMDTEGSSVREDDVLYLEDKGSRPCHGVHLPTALLTVTVYSFRIIGKGQRPNYRRWCAGGSHSIMGKIRSNI